MPSLVICGRRTLMAGDDVRLVCMVLVLMKTLQILVLVPSFLLVSEIRIQDWDQIQCGGDDGDVDATNASDHFAKYGTLFFYLYWIVSFIAAALSLALEVAIWKVSTQGSPTEVEKRQLLRPLCFVKFGPLFVINLLAMALGIVAALLLDPYCNHCFLPKDVTVWEDDQIVPTPLYFVNGTETVFWRVPCGNYNALRLCWILLLLSQCFGVAGVLVLHLVFALKAAKPSRLVKLLSCCCQDGWGWRFSVRVCCTCCSLATCCLFGGVELIFLTQEFADISLLLSDLMGASDTLDVTPSDVMAGLFMVMREQKQQRNQLRRHVSQLEAELRISKHGSSSQDLDEVEVGGHRRRSSCGGNKTVVGYRLSHRSLLVSSNSSNSAATHPRSSGGSSYCCLAEERTVLDSDNTHERQVIAEGAHFMRLALAVYGYILHMWNNGLVAPCHLTGHTIASCCRYKSPATVRGDTICGFNETAFLLQAGIQPEDLAYVSFRSGLECIPYGILVDKSWSCIVVTIRGTLSLEAAVADMLLKPQRLDECGDRCGFDGANSYAHSGMLRCAEWVYNDIQKHRILERLFSDFPDYNLVITGHSLGAGVSAILSLMMKPKYPNLRCLCFGPPGCVLSETVAAQDHILSFAMDVDLIPRLSLQSIENLRDDVLFMIERIKVPKHEVMGSYAFMHKKKDLAVSNADILHRKGHVPETEFGRQIHSFLHSSIDQKSKRNVHIVALHVPGRIVHLSRVSNDDSYQPGSWRDYYSCCRTKDTSKNTVPIWANYEDFGEIQLSSKLMSDHMPFTMSQELERIAESSFGLRPPHFHPTQRGLQTEWSNVNNDSNRTQGESFVIRAGNTEWTGRLTDRRRVIACSLDSDEEDI